MPDGNLVRDIADSFGEQRQRRGRSRAMPSMPDEALVRLPDNDRELIKVGRDLIEICRSGVGQRLEYYRFLNLITESGRKDGTKSLVNLMYTVLDRLASHLFSPTD